MTIRRNSGFTVLETMITVTIAVTVLAFSAVILPNILNNATIENGYSTTLLQMRQARQLAIDRRQVVRVTLTTPRTVLTEIQAPGGGAYSTVSSINMPTEIQFTTVSGMPSAGPDGFGNGSVALALNGSNVVRFQPDGSGQDAGGGLCNGVAYMAIPGKIETVRAVTLFGATGRIRGFRIDIKNHTWDPY